MSRKTKSQAEELPDIPDYPNSPLPAWKHYGILKVVEGKLHEELKQQKYTGHLVGLDLTYTVGPDTYAMSYGYSFEQVHEGITATVDPLSDEFVETLYDFASDLISENINPAGTRFNMQLSVSVNQQVNTKTVICQIATEANCGKNECIGKCRKFKKKNDGSWECTHKKGSCTCT
jgi:hypothetical protein